MREFKLNGRIVNPGEKDELTYGSLMYQIEVAIQQGFPDIDICSAVIKATSSSSLRSALEARPGATIAQITPALKAHFTVKNVKSVYHELGKLKQGKDENALHFFWKAVGIRELVRRMNRDENGQLTDDLIQYQFIDSLLTGFQGELRHQIRPVLKTPGVQDDTIMREITDLMLCEAEYEDKNESPPVVTATVSSVGNENSKKNKNNLMLEIAKISANVENLGSMQPQLDELRREMQVQQRVIGMLQANPTQQNVSPAPAQPTAPAPYNNAPPVYDQNFVRGPVYRNGGTRGGERGGSNNVWTIRGRGGPRGGSGGGSNGHGGGNNVNG